MENRCPKKQLKDINGRSIAKIKMIVRHKFYRCNNNPIMIEKSNRWFGIRWAGRLINQGNSIGVGDLAEGLSRPDQLVKK